jgi:two-component system sensor histidine kinase YesM
MAFQNGDRSTRILKKGANDFAYLYEQFNTMAQKVEETIQENYTQKILVQQAELRQLQAQINPHFLYNSYFLIHRMISSRDWENSVSFSEMMGKYFQYLLKGDDYHSRFSQEYEHARIYAQIQARRFQGRVEVRFGELPAEMASVPVPKLILQPILENAFEHAFESVLADGLLEVRFLCRADNQGQRFGIVEIEDNGAGAPLSTLTTLADELEAGLREGETPSGLINIHHRLKIRFGIDQGIQIARGSLGGLLVSVRFPCDGC